MSWKFNPPPGWPSQPEGWVPPPGWAPDPSWPPAPPGWEFWVPANPQAAPAADPGQSVHDAPTTLAVPTPATAAAADPGQPAAAGYPASGPPGSPPPGTPTSGTPYPGSASPGTPYPGSASPGTPYPGSASPGTPYPPGGRPAGSAPWFHRWSAFAVVAVAVLLISCVGGGGVAVLTQAGDDDPAPPPPGPTPSPAPSPSPPGPAAAGDGTISPGEERSGEGPSIVPLNLAPGAFHMVTVDYRGDDFFSVRLVDAQGDPVTFVASGRGPFGGSYPVELNISTREVAAIDFATGDGEWTVLLQDISEAPLWPDENEGTGDTVLRIDPAVAATEPLVTGTHDGESNFIVWAYAGDDGFDSLLFNVIGEHSGVSENNIDQGALILAITADGSWTLELD